MRKIFLILSLLIFSCDEEELECSIEFTGCNELTDFRPIGDTSSTPELALEYFKEYRQIYCDAIIKNTGERRLTEVYHTIYLEFSDYTYSQDSEIYLNGLLFPVDSIATERGHYDIPRSKAVENWMDNVTHFESSYECTCE